MDEIEYSHLCSDLSDCKTISGLKDICSEHNIDLFEALGYFESRETVMMYLESQIEEGDIDWLTQVLEKSKSVGKCDWGADWFRYEFLSDGSGCYVSCTEDDLPELIADVQEYAQQ